MINGQQMTVSEMARAAGVIRNTMVKRLQTMQPEQALAMGKGKAGMKPGLYPYQGQMLTRRQLCDISGAGFATMKNRLQKYSPEVAVAMGPGDRHRERPNQRKPRKPQKPRGKQHEYMGQLLTVRELAALAPCSVDVMRFRLADGIPVERAVSMGPSDRNRSRASGPNGGPTRPPKAAPKVPKLRPSAPKKPAAIRLDPAAPVICNVEPIRLPNTIGHRYAVSSPGRWIDSSECRPWARAIA
jgi:hypothetical protein